MKAEAINDIVQRIVAVAEPEQIILFGSTARGEGTSTSDLDFLVVKAGVHRRELAQRIYNHLIGVGRSIDIVVATPQDLATYGDSPALVFAQALKEGRVVYDASTAAPA
jgi:predicted nucleotidyltransferase